METNSPRAMLKWTAASAWVSTSSVVNTLLTSSSLRSGPLAGASAFPLGRGEVAAATGRSFVMTVMGLLEGQS